MEDTIFFHNVKLFLDAPFELGYVTNYDWPWVIRLFTLWNYLNSTNLLLFWWRACITCVEACLTLLVQRILGRRAAWGFGTIEPVVLPKEKSSLSPGDPAAFLKHLHPVSEMSDSQQSAESVVDSCCLKFRRPWPSSNGYSRLRVRVLRGFSVSLPRLYGLTIFGSIFHATIDANSSSLSSLTASHDTDSYSVVESVPSQCYCYRSIWTILALSRSPAKTVLFCKWGTFCPVIFLCTFIVEFRRFCSNCLRFYMRQ